MKRIRRAHQEFSQFLAALKGKYFNKMIWDTVSGKKYNFYSIVQTSKEKMQGIIFVVIIWIINLLVLLTVIS